jgi:hypothetical protein
MICKHVCAGEDVGSLWGMRENRERIAVRAQLGVEQSETVPCTGMRDGTRPVREKVERYSLNVTALRRVKNAAPYGV